MNKIEVQIPENVEQITNATTGVVACVVMLFAGIIKGVLAAIKYVFSGAFRIVSGAIAGGCASASQAAQADAAK